MTHLIALPALELAHLIRNREVSSTEVLKAFLARSDAVNPRINAMVQVASDVLERARAADEALARSELWGPLHGLPFTAKDNLDTAGLVITSSESTAPVTIKDSAGPAQVAETIRQMIDPGLAARMMPVLQSVNELIATGENQHVEFKASLPI